MASPHGGRLPKAELLGTLTQAICADLEKAELVERLVHVLCSEKAASNQRHSKTFKDPLQEIQGCVSELADKHGHLDMQVRRLKDIFERML